MPENSGITYEYSKWSEEKAKTKTAKNCKPRFLHPESNLAKMKGNAFLCKQTLREIVASKPAIHEILK